MKIKIILIAVSSMALMFTSCSKDEMGDLDTHGGGRNYTGEGKLEVKPGSEKAFDNTIYIDSIK